MKIQYDFWKLWKENLTEVQVRKRLFHNGPEISVADIVLPAKDNQPPLHRKIGRGTNIKERNDKFLRLCKVKTPFHNCDKTSGQVTQASK